MNELAINSTIDLTTIANEINVEHRACDDALKAGLNHAVRAGELLIEAKSRVEHGEWGQWLGENFEGSARTAQSYMKVAREIPNLESGDDAQTQRVADLTFRGALKELSAPAAPDDKIEPQPAVGLIQSMVEWCLRLDAVQREAVERILANPGPLEEQLTTDLTVADLKNLAGQVTVDGFMLEDDDRISYRAPLGKPPKEKKEIVYVAVPVAVDEDAELVGCIKRGCWQLGILKLKAWRLMHDWLARALTADPDTDIRVWEKQVAFNADWRQIAPAIAFVTERAFHPETTWKQWAKESEVKPAELWRNLELTEWLVGDEAEGVWRYVTGDRGPKNDKGRWKEFETTQGTS